MNIWFMLILSLGAAALMIWALRFQTEAALDWLSYLIVALITMTGVSHLALGYNGDWLLLLNGLGYLVLVCAIYFPIQFLLPYRQWLRWGLLVYTVVTIIGYFVLHPPELIDPVGLFIKAVEGLLIVLLGIEIIRKRRTAAQLPAG